MLHSRLPKLFFSLFKPPFLKLRSCVDMSAFKILIDHLKGGQTQKIDLREDPKFLGPDEPDLKFHKAVIARGETYLTGEHLIIHLQTATAIKMPCAVCNVMVEIELRVDHFYHAQPIEEIRSGVFDFSDPLREALLIELPKTAECNGGKCPERSSITPFIGSSKKETYCPFADMDKDLKIGEKNNGRTS